MPSSPKKPKKPKTNELICSQCDKPFACKQNKMQHDLHFHSDPRDAALVVASKAKKQKARVELADQKRFKCSFCPAEFGHKHSRKEHFNRIHADQTDPRVIAFKTQENAKRRKHRGGTVKKTGVHSGSASGSADTGASSSASVEVASASSPLVGAAALSDRSGCDEVSKRSQHISQHSVHRIGVNIRIASLSSLNLGLPNLGLPNLV